MSRLLFDAFDVPGGGAPSLPPGVDLTANARLLSALLPPSGLWRLLAGDVLTRVLVGCADELDRVDLRVRALLEESDPSTTTELLPEYERELGLASTGTVAERQARVVARTVARQRYRPADFRAALAPLLGQAVADVEVLERTAAMADAMGDVREIFAFFVYRDPAAPGAYYLAAAQALVDAIKPTHTAGQVIESIDFACDDVYSLCDSDLVGA